MNQLSREHKFFSFFVIDNGAHFSVESENDARKLYAGRLKVQ